VNLPGSTSAGRGPAYGVAPMLESEVVRRGSGRRTLVAWLVLVGALAGLLTAAAISQRVAGPDRLTVLGAVALGLVEGLTEYLPVSSTGHLLVVGRLLGLGGSPAEDQALDTYAICIQAGAIAAVVVLYWRRLRQMAAGLVGRDPDGRRILFALVAAFTPTVALALGLQDVVRERLFGPGPVAVAWIVGGLVILLIPSARRARAAAVGLNAITVRHAVVIGVAQAVALWPGTSRSLVTILAALAVGLSLAAAVEFSFLLGLATLGGATAFEALQNGDVLIEQFGVLTPLLGLAVAFASAVVAVRWMVSYLQSRGLEVFGWYRLGIGGLTLAALAAGRL
jgi:undecaprenyl-diphosphatase